MTGRGFALMGVRPGDPGGVTRGPLEQLQQQQEQEQRQVLALDGRLGRQTQTAVVAAATAAVLAALVLVSAELSHFWK